MALQQLEKRSLYIYASSDGANSFLLEASTGEKITADNIEISKRFLAMQVDYEAAGFRRNGGSGPGSSPNYRLFVYQAQSPLHRNIYTKALSVAPQTNNSRPILKVPFGTRTCARKNSKREKKWQPGKLFFSGCTRASFFARRKLPPYPFRLKSDREERANAASWVRSISRLVN
jgi:hypothetical protein